MVEAAVLWRRVLPMAGAADSGHHGVRLASECPAWAGPNMAHFFFFQEINYFIQSSPASSVVVYSCTMQGFAKAVGLFF